MRKLVECVPNFSEGRDRGVIEAIATSIRDAAGCTLLDVDPGASTNRTVYTFVGEPQAVVAGALAAARVARERIDMRRHSGEHPRIGALDVCPFVPVSGVTMEECVWCANLFGEALAVTLGVPVFLYGHAARADHRRTLQQIRSGEYEALAERVARPEWTPDFGPASLVPEWGATAVGARGFLVAYNVNVLGTKEQAHRIALDIRETGRGPEDPGALKAVRGMGWYVEEYGLAQVSMNLEDFRTTGLREAFGACVEAARRLGVAVCGSELVGLVPRDALLLAAEHFIREEGLFLVEEGQKIRLAVERLGLSSIQPFVPATRVIEFMLPSVESPLGSKTVREFVQAVGARTPTPGGGSVSALVGALGAALGAMVGWMTYGKRRFEEKDALMRRLIPPLHEAMESLVVLVDEDSRAFDAYWTARGMARETVEERMARDLAMQAALRRAILAPLQAMRIVDTCWDALCGLAAHGNMASRSDLEVGARALEMASWGCGRNVIINLDAMEDEAFRDSVAAEREALEHRASSLRDRVLATLDERGSQADAQGG